MLSPPRVGERIAELERLTSRGRDVVVHRIATCPDAHVGLGGVTLGYGSSGGAKRERRQAVVAERNIACHFRPAVAQVTSGNYPRAMFVPDSAVVEMASPATVISPALGFEEWRHGVCSTFVTHESVLDEHESQFEGQLASHMLGALLLARVGGSPVQVIRTPRSIRAADEGHIKVGVQVHGQCILSQDGREAILQPGDLAVYDTGRPYKLVFEQEFSMLVLMLPRALMPLRARQLADVTARRISGQHGMGAVLSPFLTLLSAKSLSGDLQPSIEVCDAVLDLVGATCRSEAEQVPDSQPASSRQALLLRVQTHIEEHLSDPSLDTLSIAQAHHVSRRYLQILFQEQGQTLRGWIRTRRLNRCKAELRDPRLRHVPVSAIGSRWGFSDPANFVRAFRAELGTTPSAWRDGEPRQLGASGS